MVEAKGCTIELEPAYTNINITGSAIIALLSGATTALGTGEIAAGELAASSVDTSELADESVTPPKQNFLGAGSPPNSGYNLQAGDGVLVDGSLVINFPSEFLAAPDVIISIKESEGAGCQDVAQAKSIDTGSFLATGSPNTGSICWIAVGSGSW